MIDVPHEQVQADDGLGRVVTMGVLNGTAVQLGDGLLAVGGEFAREVHDGPAGEARQARPPSEGLGLGPFLENPEGAHELDPVHLPGRVEVAFNGIHFAVRVNGQKLPTARDDELIFGAEAEVRRPQERAGRSVWLQTHQVCRARPTGLAVGLCGRRVRVFQEFQVVAAFLDDHADHPQRQRRVASRPDGRPAPSLRSGLGEPGIHHGDLETARREPFAHLFGHVRGAEVRLERAGAEKNNELAIRGIRFHVGLAAGPLALFELSGHLLVRDVVALFADAGVIKPVVAPESVEEPAVGPFFAAVLDPPEQADEPVVLRTEVRVLGIDQNVHAVPVFGPEGLGGHFPVSHLLGVGRHRFGEFRVPQDEQAAQTGRGAVPFSGNLPEGSAAFDDFLDGLFKRDGLPTVGAPRPRTIQHLAEAVRIVKGLDPGLPLRAELSVHGRGLFQTRRRGEVRKHRLRAVGAAVNFHGDPVEDFDFNGTSRVALEANRVNLVLRPGEGVDRPFGDPRHGRPRPLNLVGHERRSAQQRRALENGPPRHPA